jgi:flagellar biosynthesis protein FlhB
VSDTPDQDQKTEAPTPKKRKDATEKGDVLQSKELGTALVILSGAIWIALIGPIMINALEVMVTDALSFDHQDLRNFDPAGTAFRLLSIIVLPLFGLFLVALVAAVGTPAALGSLGFRAKAISFKGGKLNPLKGIKRIFGMQGLIELGKSLAKVALLGSVGLWLLLSQTRSLVGLGATELRPALGEVGQTFVLAVIAMALALGVIAMIDVPAQMMQRTKRLRMTRQEVKDENKQTEGSPELKGAVRRRQLETARNSARGAMAEATVLLTNPTHFAVALRYRPGEDAAPVVVARGRDVIAAALRELAAELDVPMLSYPQLTRALYFTARTGQTIREDLYLAVATVLAFVFNIEAALAAGAKQPDVEIPPDARFDARGRPEV